MYVCLCKGVYVCDSNLAPTGVLLNLLNKLLHFGWGFESEGLFVRYVLPTVSPGESLHVGSLGCAIPGGPGRTASSVGVFPWLSPSKTLLAGPCTECLSVAMSVAAMTACLSL